MYKRLLEKFYDLARASYQHCRSQPPLKVLTVQVLLIESHRRKEQTQSVDSGDRNPQLVEHPVYWIRSSLYR